MQGRPVWLASVSLRNATNNKILPAESWRNDTIKAAERIIKTQILKGVGNERMERMFRMCMTLCFHRALTDEEIAGLPNWFLSYKPTNFAGGPLLTYYTKGIPELPTIAACKKPEKTYMDFTLETYTVNDCGECLPCKARIALQQYVEDLPWPMREKELYRRIEMFNKRLAKLDDILVVER